jgi:hypothetical protein
LHSASQHHQAAFGSRSPAISSNGRQHVTLPSAVAVVACRRTEQPTRAHVAAPFATSHIASMKARKRPRRRTTAGALSLPIMISDMTLSSLETIARRTWMMAQGRCSAAEYRQMVLEKAHAAHCSASALVSSRGKDRALAVLVPWHSRAKANARRLRKK